MSSLLPAFMSTGGGTRDINIVVSASRALSVPPPNNSAVNGSVGEGISGYLQLAEVDMENRVVILGEEVRIVVVGTETRSVSVSSENRTVQA